MFGVICPARVPSSVHLWNLLQIRFRGECNEGGHSIVSSWLDSQACAQPCW